MIRRFGAIGDVHAEDGLLRAALAHLQSLGVDAVLCVGDIVDGRGDVDACCTLLAEHGALSVRGNHERWILADQMRGLSMAHHLRELTEETRAYLGSLPVTRRLDTVVGPLLLCHGLGEDDMARLRPYDEGYALECIDALPSLRASDLALVVGGHTHQRMVRRIGRLTIVNAGTLAVGSASESEAPCFARADLDAGLVQFYEFDAKGSVREAERFAVA